uniref:Uncharacterized protein n=1 Tax=Sphaerodactylus townsendi TaxID=933632 RepID=A0ACB8F7H2_9SAUR
MERRDVGSSPEQEKAEALPRKARHGSHWGSGSQRPPQSGEDIGRSLLGGSSSEQGQKEGGTEAVPRGSEDTRGLHGDAAVTSEDTNVLSGVAFLEDTGSDPGSPSGGGVGEMGEEMEKERGGVKGGEITSSCSAHALPGVSSTPAADAPLSRPIERGEGKLTGLLESRKNFDTDIDIDAECSELSSEYPLPQRTVKRKRKEHEHRSSRQVPRLQLEQTDSWLRKKRGEETFTGTPSNSLGYRKEKSDVGTLVGGTSQGEMSQEGGQPMGETPRSPATAIEGGKDVSWEVAQDAHFEDSELLGACGGVERGDASQASDPNKLSESYMMETILSDVLVIPKVDILAVIMPPGL